MLPKHRNLATIEGDAPDGPPFFHNRSDALAALQMANRGARPIVMNVQNRLRMGANR